MYLKVENYKNKKLNVTNLFQGQNTLENVLVTDSTGWNKASRVV